jgi:DNA repair exonuclease SbcCD ATPase subunit
MKIRSVKIKNFRKFVGTYLVDGMTDGVNVLVGRNELGKSTLLAAINGVIFEKANSQAETVRSFRHSITGNVPEVELTFDLDDTQWTIHKRFAYQSGKSVLTNSKNLRYEDEAAESQIQKLFEIGKRRGVAEHGIWGTLWVNQRRSFGDPEIDDVGRSTLQSCIEAQVGLVMGGERGRKIPLSVDQALRELLSSKGPSGQYKDTLERLEEVSARVIQLEAKRNENFDRMDALTGQKRELKSLNSDWSDDDHRRELDEARALRLNAATRALEIDAARNESKNATERAERERQAVKERATLAGNLESIDTAILALTDEITTTKADAKEKRAKLDTCEKTLADLRDKLRISGEQNRRFERLRNAVAFQDEIERHEETLNKAAVLKEECGRLSELIGQIKTTDDSVSRIETAENSLAIAKAALQAIATKVEITINADALGLVRLDSAVVPSVMTSHSIVARMQIEIDGIGGITIEPQIRERDEMLNQFQLAEDELKSALDVAGAIDMRAARQAAAQRREFERHLSEARREILALAPKEKAAKIDAGLESRQTRVRELQGRLKTELESLGVSTPLSNQEIEKGISETHDIVEKLTADIANAETAVGGPKSALSEVTVSLHELEQRLAGLRGNSETIQARLTVGRDHCSDEQLTANVTELARLAEEAQTALKSLENSQGETVVAVDARIKRLEAAGKNYHDKVVRLNTEITRLSTWIEANEGAGVEEDLEAARAEQARLEATGKGYEEEVRVLQLLQQTLRESESESKSLYLAPVVSLVEPYLKMLLPGSSLVLDENLGISSIMRNGTDEAFDRLSDGTQEQLAILTRLAFAELLLEKGRPATVILDDAMVFSDDDRIERMFDILTRAGGKVQILVLTCRKKLFTKFGAEELNLKEMPS